MTTNENRIDNFQRVLCRKVHRWWLFVDGGEIGMILSLFLGFFSNFGQTLSLSMDVSSSTLSRSQSLQLRDILRLLRAQFQKICKILDSGVREIPCFICIVFA